MKMNFAMKRYEAPTIERCEVEVEVGYKSSISVELPEIDGTKEEGEWSYEELFEYIVIRTVGRMYRF